MSKVSIVGDPSGTGTFTISAPNGNTDRTLVLPDEAGTVLTSASNVTASQITTALNATGSAPIYAARAWVNFNGTGTVAIRAAGNVSSITDVGTGNYTVNFTTAMSDTDYAVSGFAIFSTTTPAGLFTAGSNFAPAVDSVQVRAANSTTGAPIDSAHVHVTIFR